MGSIIITHKIESIIIISKCTVKWYIICTVQGKYVFLKIWVEFQISGKLWLPCFGKTWVTRSIHIISVDHLEQRWELPVLRYHSIRVNYPYPFLGVIFR